MKTCFACISTCLLLACSESNGSPPAVDAAGFEASTEAAPLVPGCSAAPNPSPKLPGSRDPTVLAGAAAVLGSCMGDDGINRTLTNLWNIEINAALAGGCAGLQAECLDNAHCGCGAMKACLGFEQSRVDATCISGCDGNIFTLCSTLDDPQGLRSTIDCSREGLVCDPLAICQEAPTVACDPKTYGLSCDADGRSEICRSKGAGNALFKGPICASLGLSCSNGVCVGKGAACSGGYPGPEGQTDMEGTACSGTSLVACVGGGMQTFDCARIAPGFSCQSVDSTYFCGLASECVPGNIPAGRSVTQNYCEGSTVVLCNAGRIDRVDCLGLGFSGCEINRPNGKLGCVPGMTY